MIFASRILSFILGLLFLLTACSCSSYQTSVEKNARHAASSIAKIHFDPNLRLSTAGNIKALKPLLQQFYDQGKMDRIEGLTLAQAQQRAENFKCPGVIPAGGKIVVLGKVYDAYEPEKQSQLILQSATATYWDGYNGRL